MAHVRASDGTVVAYGVSGEGPPLLLLHGFTGDGASMAPLANALADHRTVIAPDLVGHGATQAPAEPTRYSMASIAHQLAAVIDDVGASQVDLVGYSFGGRVALSFACSHPSSVTSLVTIGASPGLTGPAAEQRRAADEQLADRIDVEGVEWFVDHWLALPMWRSLEESLGPQAWELSRQQRRAGTAVGYANSLRGAGTGAMPPLHDELRSMRAPTLLLAGGNDTKFVEIANALAHIVPNARVELIDGAGHAAHLEQPALTAHAILRHLRCS